MHSGPASERESEQPSSLDLALVRSGLLTSGGSLGIAGVAGVAPGPAPATFPVMGGTALFFILWYAAWGVLFRRGAGVAFFRTANPLLLIFVPTVFAATLVRVGPTYGLDAWIPPLFYTLVISLSALRRRPWLPMTLGLIAAVSYGSLYVFWIDAQLQQTLGVGRALEVAIPRMLGLLVIGIAAAAIARSLDTNVRHAVDEDRAKKLFGKYLVGEQIASGGMGTVSRATYCPEGGFVREVAVKELHPHLAGDPALIDAFRLEAELSARLHHPNIVSVLDFGKAKETYFMAMEYVDGWSLRFVLDRARAAERQLPEALVGLIGTELLSGLDYAHDQARAESGERLRVVHRDLSPANVLVSRAGQLKITDFGIARALKDNTAHQTQRLVGKLSYLAPEVASGKPFDTRADLYAAALLLYELLTLCSPRRRASETSTWRAVLKGGSPGVQQHRPDASAEWGPFFTRALAKDPDARFSDAREMKSALLRIVPPSAFPLADELGPLLEELTAGVVLPVSERVPTLTKVVNAGSDIHSQITELITGPIQGLGSADATEAA